MRSGSGSAKAEVAVPVPQHLTIEGFSFGLKPNYEPFLKRLFSSRLGSGSEIFYQIDFGGSGYLVL
jgi:hypothetical protein